jgi:transglutaminase-like putative cysteine protease
MRRPDRAGLDPATRLAVLVAGASCVLPLVLQLSGRLAIGIGIVAVLVALISWRRPAPSWLRLLLALALTGAVLATMGVNFGRDTGCAMLAAMLAIKPAETANLRDARSLIGFALFAPFATFLLDQGPLSLLLALVAVLLSLAAMQRLSDVESGALRGVFAPWRQLWASGRMLAIGLPLALAAFWLFPRLAAPLWGVPQRAQAKPGLSDTMSPGQWGDMLLDDTPAARVRFFGPTPPRERMYWRGPVMTEFDGRTWRQPDWMRLLPRPSLAPAGSSFDYEIEVEPTERRQLVALDVPLSAPEGAMLGADYTLRAEQALNNVSRWRMRSAPPGSFEPQLSPAARARSLALPTGLNPRTVALGQQWRVQAGADDAAIVRRALDLIRGGFAYTLSVPPAGRNAVDEFLFTQKAGYCEQFSSSFVVLMRAAGIPARVVGGYAGAEFNTIGGYWILRNSDAHAWTEVWLPGRGWTRVDPTAAVAPERVFDTLQDRARASGNDLLVQLTPMFNATDWLRRGWNDFVLGFNAERQRQMLRPLGIDQLDPQRLMLMFAMVAVLALAATAWLVSRDIRQRDPLLRAWHRLAARYGKVGLGRAPHEAAIDWARRVDRERGGDPVLLGLSRRFSDWRYAAPTSDGPARAALRALVRDLRAHRP